MPRTVLGNRIHVHLRPWAVMFYAAGAAAMLPWTIYLSVTLPTRELSRDWDAVWGGFDAFMLITLAMTAFFLAKKSMWVIMSSTALATALAIDAWFDILTAKPGHDTNIAVALAVFAELPVAIVSLILAIRAAKQLRVLLNQHT